MFSGISHDCSSQRYTKYANFLGVKRCELSSSSWWCIRNSPLQVSNLGSSPNKCLALSVSTAFDCIRIWSIYERKWAPTLVIILLSICDPAISIVGISIADMAMIVKILIVRKSPTNIGTNYRHTPRANFFLDVWAQRNINQTQSKRFTAYEVRELIVYSSCVFLLCWWKKPLDTDVQK